MSEIRWLADRDIRLIHSRMIADFGGADGVRDSGLLASAVMRPQNLSAYGEPTPADLAASLAYGIASNHPFVDGNKRSALVAADVFLQINGWELTAGEAEATVVFMDLAAGTLSEADLAVWFSANTGPYDPDR